MSPGTYAYLRERFDFWKAFAGIVISCEVHMGEPQPEIFEYLLHPHALVAADTVFIDNPAANIEAAQAAGTDGQAGSLSAAPRRHILEQRGEAINT
jgi:putative hydrolase of the HAD superfamily